MAAPPRRLIVIAVGALVALIVVAGLVYVLHRRAEAPSGPAQIFPYGALRVGVDASNPPFAAATKTDLAGLDIDLAKALGQRLNVPVQFVQLGYDGLYDALKADQADALISAVLVDPTRLNAVMYTLPYFDAGLVLVSDKGSPYTSMAAMPGHSVAFEYGSEADAETRRWLRRVLPFERKPYELSSYALDAVRLGQADAALIDAVSARLYLRDHPMWATQMSYVTSEKYAIAVRIDRGPMWDALNNAMAAMIADGSLDKIVGKWL